MRRMLGMLLLIAVVFSVPIYSQRRGKQEAQPRILTVDGNVPSLAVLAETEQSQVKSGLRITMLPETYQAQVTTTTQDRQVPPPSLLGMSVTRPGQVYVERTQSPLLTISPSRLIFRLQISNQMPRVFRGSGIAVQFNVAGKNVPVDPSGYGDLINVVAPPRSEQQITINGPEISTIPGPCTIGIFLYDVVTNMDQAGNVTEKQNFEWYFSYQLQAVQKEVSVQPPQRMWISR